MALISTGSAPAALPGGRDVANAATVPDSRLANAMNAPQAGSSLATALSAVPTPSGAPRPSHPNDSQADNLSTGRTKAFPKARAAFGGGRRAF